MEVFSPLSVPVHQPILEIALEEESLHSRHKSQKFCRKTPRLTDLLGWHDPAMAMARIHTPGLLPIGD